MKNCNSLTGINQKIPGVKLNVIGADFSSICEEHVIIFRIKRLVTRIKTVPHKMTISNIKIKL